MEQKATPEIAPPVSVGMDKELFYIHLVNGYHLLPLLSSFYSFPSFLFLPLYHLPYLLLFLFLFLSSLLLFVSFWWQWIYTHSAAAMLQVAEFKKLIKLKFGMVPALLSLLSENACTFILCLSLNMAEMNEINQSQFKQVLECILF